MAPSQGNRGWQKMASSLAAWGNNEESQPVCEENNAESQPVREKKVVTISAFGWKEKNGGMGEWNCLPPFPHEVRFRWWSVHVGKGWQSCHTPLPSNNYPQLINRIFNVVVDWWDKERWVSQKGGWQLNGFNSWHIAFPIGPRFNNSPSLSLGKSFPFHQGCIDAVSWVHFN